MYTPRLDNLIKGALADGVLEPAEVNVLRRVAAEEGFDPDEVMMDVNARLYDMKSAAAAPPMPAAPKTTSKHGDVKKCPNCGAVVNGNIGKCPECGFAFSGIQANSSAQRLAEQINEVVAQHQQTKLNVFSAGFKQQENERQIATLISSFPVPTTKEDLCEFIIYCHSNYESFKHMLAAPGTQKAAWKAKRNECVNKANAFFADDQDVQRVLGQVGVKPDEPKKKKSGLFGMFGK